jgi:hypothetical protein
MSQHHYWIEDTYFDEYIFFILYISSGVCIPISLNLNYNNTFIIIILFGGSHTAVTVGSYFILTPHSHGS